MPARCRDQPLVLRVALTPAPVTAQMARQHRLDDVMAQNDASARCVAGQMRQPGTVGKGVKADTRITARKIAFGPGPHGKPAPPMLVP